MKPTMPDAITTTLNGASQPRIAIPGRIQTEAFDQASQSHGEVTDRRLAAAVRAALGELQDALDAAVLAGLIVEPRFTEFAGRFTELGSDAASYVGSVEVYRKLA